MVIEELGRITPMDTGEKDKNGNPIMDLTGRTAKAANARLLMDEAEKARLLLERAANGNKTLEEVGEEIGDIIEKLRGG